MSTILILLMVCGQVDTVIIKEPSKAPVYTHSIDEDTKHTVAEVLKSKPVIIIYKEDRGVCV